MSAKRIGKLQNVMIVACKNRRVYSRSDNPRSWPNLGYQIAEGYLENISMEPGDKRDKAVEYWGERLHTGLGTLLQRLRAMGYPFWPKRDTGTGHIIAVARNTKWSEYEAYSLKELTWNDINRPFRDEGDDFVLQLKQHFNRVAKGLLLPGFFPPISNN